MSKINYGGPAFPTENARQTGPSSWHEEGMSLRDYFAAKAMQTSLRTAKGGSAEDAIKQAVETAYLVADAMLRERAIWADIDRQIEEDDAREASS